MNPLPQSVAAGAAPVTFSKDIQPLLLAHCATCHRPEGSASFSLVTYADVRQRAAQMVTATKSRYMPPWKPEPGVGDFVGVRRLADEQIALLERWVIDGMIEGTTAGAALPGVLPSGAWRLGPPDLVLTMPAYTLRAGGDDMYRHFVLPVPIPARRYVKAWELRPGNLRVVHHATMEVDSTGMSRHLDEQDPLPGYEGLIAHTSMAPDGYFLDWAPGHTPYVAPDGMAFPVEEKQRPGADAALASQRATRSRSGERRSLLHRYATFARSRLASPDPARHRHSGGGNASRGRDSHTGCPLTSTFTPSSLTPITWRGR